MTAGTNAASQLEHTIRATGRFALRLPSGSVAIQGIDGDVARVVPREVTDPGVLDPLGAAGSSARDDRLDDPSLVRNIVADGCERARKLAEETMRDVREAMGLRYD